ncbi:MAG TPA: long-chain-fatty-acid--CoA ligase [Burkholderiaceae bacterium]|jgi:acyl-CoA synthetase (AMP-forming)/AMP-acid ligase II|nr:long-chain-fatty-acid--CoA ligase [Burkholderiaceae bacterium]
MPTQGQIIERNARFHPRREAIVCGPVRLSHAQYARRVRKLAAALYQQGLRRGERLSILAMNCAEYLEIYGAAEWAGFVLNTLNWRLAPAEIDWIVGDVQPRALVFEAQYLPVVEQLRHRKHGIDHWICIGPLGVWPSWATAYEELVDAGAEEGSPERAREDDPLCIIYTSGTTGRPKGVVLSHRAYASLSDILSGELPLRGDDRLLAIAPLFHIGARSLGSGVQWRGGTIVLQRGFDAEEVVRTIERERVTAVHLVPTMVAALLDAPNFGAHDLSTLRTLMYAAAPMPVPLLRRALAAFGPILVNGYGQTEINLPTLLHAWQHRPDGTPEQVARLASVGQPHPRSEVRIVADDGRDCPVGVPGEVLARSATSMSGYWRNDEATAAALSDGWVRTGDIGYLDAEGYLFLVDRKKDMIISGGENIYSREVEEALLDHPAVAEVAVIGVPDAYWGEAVKAVVVCKEGAAADAAALIAHARGRIASYKCPKSVDFVAELPLLGTGKVSKRALRERFGAAAIQEAR